MLNGNFTGNSENSLAPLRHQKRRVECGEDARDPTCADASSDDRHPIRMIVLLRRVPVGTVLITCRAPATRTSRVFSVAHPTPDSLRGSVVALGWTMVGRA